MWLFRKMSEADRFEIGYFMPNGEWRWEIRVDDGLSAMRTINYLNGGDGDRPPVAAVWKVNE